MSSKQLKRIANAVANAKGKRASSFERLRSMRVVVPDKRQVRMSSGKVSAVVGGVVVTGDQGPERKKADLNVAATTVTTGAPYIASLTSLIAEGSQAANRIGGRIHIKGIDIELNWGNTTTTPTAASAPVYFDILLVWDKQPNGGVTTVGSILTSAATNLTFGNLPNIERYQVLKRERLCMSFPSDWAGIVHWHQDLNCACRFNDTTGSPITNDFYVVCVSTAAGGAGNFTPTISYVARVTFTDE